MSLGDGCLRVMEDGKAALCGRKRGRRGTVESSISYIFDSTSSATAEEVGGVGAGIGGPWISVGRRACQQARRANGVGI